MASKVLPAFVLTMTEDPAFKMLNAPLFSYDERQPLWSDTSA